MRFLWVVFSFCGTGCFAVEALIERNEISIVKIEDPEQISSSRSGRKLLKKLHSGVAFLAGVKLGSYLTSKSQLFPSVGHGSLASAHNFQLFGKTVSTALSLSYGNNQLALPLHDPVQSEDTNSSSTRSPMQHVLITVLDNPTSQELDKLKAIAKITEDTSYILNQTNSLKTKQNDPLNQLVQNHNHRVHQLNEDVPPHHQSIQKSRINSKF